MKGAFSLLCALVIGGFASPADAQTAAFKANGSLLAEASEGSPAVCAISAGEKASVVERKGFWVKVKASNGAGWVKLSALSIEQAQGAGGASVLAGLATGRAGTGNIVSTSGTRGLSDADLKNARPDPNAVAKVKSFAVTSADAAAYAKAGGLAERRIAYPPAPDSGSPPHSP